MLLSLSLDFLFTFRVESKLRHHKGLGDPLESRVAVYPLRRVFYRRQHHHTHRNTTLRLRLMTDSSYVVRRRLSTYAAAQAYAPFGTADGLVWGITKGNSTCVGFGVFSSKITAYAIFSWHNTS